MITTPTSRSKSTISHLLVALQFAAMGMIFMSFGALITCMFKNARFIDIAVLELVVFMLAVLIGFPFASLADQDRDPIPFRPVCVSWRQR